MAKDTKYSRRRFVGTGAMTVAHLGTLLAADAKAAESRELAALGRAPEWLNSPRLTATDLLGKVVVVDFWTYTCINWLRTLPYVRAWSRKYRQGLVVIGVHTPEFAFERNLVNVRRAVQQMRIDYPVVIDNDYSIWRAFQNQYWPALYLVDARGRVRQHQFGEGEYERSEKAIQRLLAEAGVSPVRETVASVEAAGIEAPADWANLKSAGELPRLRADAELCVAWRRRRGSAARLCGARAIVTQSMGAGWRVDAWPTGRRTEQLAMGGSCAGFTHAICISSWDRPGKGARSVSECR